ncbi:N-terminal domain of NEFA-interacting nuclear protein NIP30-domain-containing protein [Rhizoctonia solani]|nr:N-terminal domain of NEFA-interacting nuclear protein NIP30-domain-containing protein [Rhizoctonia solani]
MEDGNPLTSLAATGSVASRFVTQTEIDSAKERRDEQWKAAYARLGQEPPPQPTEDTEYDGRSLYERLQANKVAKQEQWEEQNKLSNQFRALEEDEIHFLDGLVDEKIIKERKRKEEENEELKGFREAVSQREAQQVAASGPAPPTSTPKPPAPKAVAPAPAKTKAKKNQKALLKGAIVRKPSAPAPGSTKSAPKPPTPVKPAAEESKSAPQLAESGGKPTTPPTDEASSGKKRPEPSVTDALGEASEEAQSSKRQKI